MNNKSYLLTLLLLILACNWVERTALGLVLQDIKVDLNLTDTQLGVLTGIAFAVFYAIMGVPIARWADRGNRILIICVSTALCSAAVALSGLAASFVQLLLIRIFVGVGEAGCAPAGHSLIAEHFGRGERPRAAAIFATGVPLSMVIGYFLAGWLNELYGWRTTFVVLGLPGLAITLLAALTLKEPRSRSLRQGKAFTLEPVQSFRQVCSFLWCNKSFRHLLIGFSIANFFVYGITQWQPAFFVRSHHLETGTLGTYFALIYGFGGFIGMYAGGLWASRHPHDEALHLRFTAVTYIVLGLLSPFIYLVPRPTPAFILLAVVSFGYFATFGPTVATIQTLVPERMRATAFAILYLFVNLVGIGLGPLAVGVLSDAWSSWATEHSLQYALIAFSPGYIWAAWHIWRASHTVKSDLQEAQALPCSRWSNV